MDCLRFQLLTMNPQLGTLELNPKTGEPFLRLYSHHDIIITPPRWDDAPQFIPYLNDPLVNKWMSGPPVPYTEGKLFTVIPRIWQRKLICCTDDCAEVDAQNWLNHVKPPADAVLKQLEEAKDQLDPLIVVGHCPVSIIRKVNEDGSDLMIGAVDIFRDGGGEVVVSATNPEEYVECVKSKAENVQLNMNRAPGDPEIIWSFGGE